MRDPLRDFHGRLRSVAVAIWLASLLLPSGCGDGGASAPASMRLSVKGMHCEGCEGAIEEKVGRIDGVASCSASHLEESVEVLAPAERRTEIEAAIRRLGYTID